MASQLLHSERSAGSSRRAAESLGSKQMRKDSLTRFSAIALALLTATTVVFAVINWQKEQEYVNATDGAWWKEDHGALLAKGIIPNGPADKAGIKVGDQLLLCTDGLTGTVEDLTIANVLSQATSAQSACQDLVDLALAAGGSDNITVVVAHFLRSS